jgi:hypothetical protein
MRNETKKSKEQGNQGGKVEKQSKGKGKGKEPYFSSFLSLPYSP